MMSFAAICVFFSLQVISHSFPTIGDMVNTTVPTSVNTTTTLLPLYPTTLFNITTTNYTFDNHTIPRNNRMGAALTYTFVGIIGGIFLSIVLCCYINRKCRDKTAYPTEPCCGIEC